MIADVHLGYEWARGSGGDSLPPHSLRETLHKLNCLFESTPIHRLIVAGDLVETPKPCFRTSHDVRTLITWLRDRGIEPILLKGNHDPRLRTPLLSTFDLDDWTILHGDRTLPESACILGHHHPALKAAGLVAPCFLVGSRTIVLPAFSPNAAGLDISTGWLPTPLHREPLRCWAGVGEELLDFGLVEELPIRLGRRTKADRRSTHLPQSR